MKNTKKIVRMVQMSLLAALVLVLQLMGSFVKIGPLPMSFVLVPIVIGAFILGPKEGAILGAIFGTITMVMGISGVDAFSALLWTANPLWFVAICILKATLAGLGSGLIYKGLDKLFKGRFKTLKTVLASVSAPIINTGIFVIGMLLFFFDTMSDMAAGTEYKTAIEFIFLGLAGVNFIGEFLVNLVLSPAIVRIINVIEKKIKRA